MKEGIAGVKLFEPITIGKVTLKNRSVFASYETNFATEEG
jgi:2,4-dienoyl-CoA reductase-like NADH-dependent reductase (Old Yellow Enzyme family)